MLRSLTTLLLGTLCLTGTAFSNHQVDVLYNITGKDKSIDHDAWQGAELAATELNAQHIPVSLVLYDGQSRDTIQHAITSMRSKQHSTPIMIGLTHSNHLCSIVSPQTQAKHIFINADSASVTSQHLGDDYFMTAATFEQKANQAANFLYNQLQKKQTILLSNTQNKHQHLAKKFVTTFSKLGGKVQRIALPSALTKRDRSQLLAHLKNQLANTSDVAIYLTAPEDQASTLIKDIRSHGITSTIMMSAPLAPQHMKSLSGTQIAPLYYTAHAFMTSSNPSPAMQHFKNAYQKRYHKAPSANAALGYDAVILVGYAISQSPDYSEEALRKSLKGIHKAPLVTGDITPSDSEPVDRVAILGLSNELVEFDASHRKMRA